MGQAASHASEPCDDRLCFRRRTRRVFHEILLHALAMLGQDRWLATPAELTDACEAAFQVGVQVALDRSSRYISGLGDGGVGEAAVLQPKDRHLLLHARMRMAVAFVANNVEFRFRE